MKETPSLYRIAKEILLSPAVKLFMVVALIAVQSNAALAQKNIKKTPAKKNVKVSLKDDDNDIAPALYVSPSGNVGVGTNDPHHKLQVNGNLHMDGNSIYFPAGWKDSTAFIKWRLPDDFTGSAADDYKLTLASYDGIKMGDMRAFRKFFPILRVGFHNQWGAVDIMSEERRGNHIANRLAMYVTGGAMDVRGSGVEFRNSDGSEGIGFTKNIIYQTGGDKDLNIEAGGIGNINLNSAVKLNRTVTVNRNLFFGSNAYVSMENNVDAYNPAHDGTYMQFTNSEDGNGKNSGFRFTQNPLNKSPILRLRGKFVGIGIDNPEVPLDVRGRRGDGDKYTGRELNRYGIGEPNDRGFATCSVYADGDFVTKNAFIGSSNTTFSDIRLKKDIHISSSENDLAALRHVQVVDYKMIDTINDNTAYKKVIAQQVQQVYPRAVSTSFKTLPNVFQKATSVIHLQDSLYLINVANPQPLKAGDKIELKFSLAADTTVRVTQINSSSSFTVASSMPLDKQTGVFVYGALSTDVLTVDYDAISMLNVSATQQLAKTIDEQQKLIQQLTLENEKLRKEQSDSKTTVNAILQRLLQLEEGKSNAGGAFTAAAPVVK